MVRPTLCTVGFPEVFTNALVHVFAKLTHTHARTHTHTYTHTYTHITHTHSPLLWSKHHRSRIQSPASTRTGQALRSDAASLLKAKCSRKCAAAAEGACSHLHPLLSSVGGGRTWPNPALDVHRPLIPRIAARRANFRQANSRVRQAFSWPGFGRGVGTPASNFVN